MHQETIDFRNEPFLVRSKPAIETSPFPHVIIDNAFSPEILAEMTFRIKTIISLGLHETKVPYRFVKSSMKDVGSVEAYDAYTLSLPRALAAPMNIFYSMEWFCFFQELFGFPFTKDIMACFHHHKINSRSGTVHTDYHFCNFVHDPIPNGINPFGGGTIYQGPWDSLPHVKHPARAVAVIFFLGNEPWAPANGGETALYHANDLKNPAKLVAPINNRILAFEVSPRSFHAFRQNINSARTSAIMWFHGDEHTLTSRYGSTPKKLGATAPLGE